MTNQKGTVLQITLIMLFIITFNILTIFNYCIIQAKAIKRIELIDQQRILEVTLIAYFKNEVKNSLLLSDEYIEDNKIVKYIVDDMGDEYEITVEETSGFNVIMKISLDKSKFKVNKISYESK